MMKHLLRIAAVLSFVFAFIDPRPARAANAVVQPPCDEAAFDAAFNSVQASGGGTLTFNCGGPAAIPFSSQKVLLADTVLDGGGRITLSGGQTTRLFFVNTGLSLTVRALTLQAGYTDVGGGLIEIFGGKVLLDEARLLDSRATTAGGGINCSIDNGAGEITIQDSDLERLSARNGGAIYSGGCALTVTGSQLIGNQAVPQGDNFGKGGAIYLDLPAQLLAQNTRFDGNQGYTGGALYVSAGATAKLYSATLDSNRARYGGAIQNWGGLFISASLLDRNQATGQGGAIWNFPGDAQYPGYIFIQSSTLRRNVAGEGGGLLTYYGPVDLAGVWVDGNVATAAGGGGLYSAGGKMSIVRSTISNNVAAGASGDGGGIFSWSSGDLELFNVTVANNQAPGGRGGGLYHRNRAAWLTHVTFSGNLAKNGGQIYQDPIGVYGITLEASALDGVGAVCASPNFNALSSNGYNRVQGACLMGAMSTDRLMAGDLGLLPLGDYGFTIPTLLPAAGSQLVDAIPAGDCHPAAGSDQRSEPRPSGAGCEVGAVERQPKDQVPAPPPAPEPIRVFLPVLIR